jgi:hypothetical protein
MGLSRRVYGMYKTAKGKRRNPTYFRKIKSLA